MKLKPLSWEEHVQRGHTPFRRDCQICQEAAARGRMHKKTSHPRAGILSLDVSGHYVRGNDLECEAKFMLVGAFTLRSRSGGEKVEVSEEVEAGPEMEIQEDEIKEGREVPEVRLEAAEVEGVEEDWEMVGCEEEVVEVEDEEGIEERQDPEIVEAWSSFDGKDKGGSVEWDHRFVSQATNGWLHGPHFTHRSRKRICQQGFQVLDAVKRNYPQRQLRRGPQSQRKSRKNGWRGEVLGEESISCSRDGRQMVAYGDEVRYGE